MEAKSAPPKGVKSKSTFPKRGNSRDQCTFLAGLSLEQDLGKREVPKQYPALRTKDDQGDSKGASSKQNKDSQGMHTMQNSKKSRQNSLSHHPQSTHQVPCKRPYDTAKEP